MTTIELNSAWLSLQELEEILQSNSTVTLSQDLVGKIVACRAYLDKKIEESDELIYGINTGFGSLCNTAISKDSLSELQRNLVLSHACGVGEEVPKELVKRMLLLKVLGLSKGHSGVQLLTVERLLFFYNHNILPVVYQQGSLGASGDLAPLAHLSLPLIGEGEVYYNNEKISSKQVLKQFNLEPITLQSKEGLALLNGTQFMSSYASHAIHESLKLWNRWIAVAAVSLDAYAGRRNPFQANVNEIRHQVGQITTAKYMDQVLAASPLSSTKKEHVQDPYSFRCIPQVHGATYDTLQYAQQIIEREINAVTDNPTIFPETDDVVSAGNFHGQPLALTMDYLAIAMAELGSISERRVYKLISGTRGLPAFLVATPGLNSGFMIPQYAAASVVSQNKQLCTPASVDTIDSSNGQEDHVSMGANAATKLYRVLENCWTLQGIEWLTATQALEFRRPNETHPELEKHIADFRKEVPFLEKDAYFHPLINDSIHFVKHMSWKN